MLVAEWDNLRCAVVILTVYTAVQLKPGNSHLPGVTSSLPNQSHSLRSAL
jgi:hypothetical protein